MRGASRGSCDGVSEGAPTYPGRGRAGGDWTQRGSHRLCSGRMGRHCLRSLSAVRTEPGSSSKIDDPLIN